MLSDKHVMLTQYCCHDESVSPALGGKQRSVTWKLRASGLHKLIVIELHASDTEAGVTINGKKVFPNEAPEPKSVLNEDFEYEFPSIIGCIRGLDEKDIFEMQPGIACSNSHWLPATLTGQREDGSLDVVVELPSADEGGAARQVAHPAVSSKQVRVMATQQPPESHQYTLKFSVPAKDPRAAGLFLDGEPIGHDLLRPTPAHCRPGAADSALPRVQLDVNLDRSSVTTDAGHSCFSHFLSNEPRRGPMTSERMMRCWTLQIGPFNEHKIILERRFVSSDILTLTVDGEHLVEASAQDLQCRSDTWECQWSFVGERLLEFDVHDENCWGDAEPTKGAVCQRLHTKVKCCVSLENLDFSSATLSIDGQDFDDLQSKYDPSEPSICTAPETLLLQYDLTVPHRISEDTAKGSYSSWASNALACWRLDLQSIAGCCSRPSLAIAAVEPVFPPAFAAAIKERCGLGVEDKEMELSPKRQSIVISNLIK